MKEFWIILKINFTNFAINSFKDLNIIKISNELEEIMNLSFYNIGKRNYFNDDFELHNAVMNNNLRLIRKICALESYFSYNLVLLTCIVILMILMQIATPH